MDNLSKVNWASSSKATSDGQPTKTQLNAPYPTLQPSSSSGVIRTSKQGQTPVNGRTMGFKLPEKSSAPSKDSFSNLVSFGSNKGGSNVSLLERQRQLAEEKSRRESEHKEKSQLQSTTWENQFWDNLGQGRNLSKDSTGKTASLRTAPSTSLNTSSTRQDSSDDPAPRLTANEGDDLLFAFSAAAPVNSSTHFLPPSVSSNSTVQTHAADTRTLRLGNGAPKEIGEDILSVDASDPFGLGPLDSKHPPSRSKTTVEGDDDILGLLGKPVNTTSTMHPANLMSGTTAADRTSDDSDTGPEQKSVSELVEMGFSAEKAREALATTGTGLDVQAAVGWLLDAAHREAKEQQNSQRSVGRDTPRSDITNADELSNVNGVKPAWMRQNNRPGSGQNRSDTRSPKRGDKDITHVASDIGSNLLKSANNIWKTGKKKVQKAVDELQYDSDPNQPKWMKEVQRHATGQEGVIKSDEYIRENQKDTASYPNSTKGVSERRDIPNVVTEEALMLEGNGPRPQARAQVTTRGRSISPAAITDLEMINNASIRQPSRVGDELLQPRKSSGLSKPSTEPMSYTRRLNKAVTEEESMQAYTSPARRKAQAQEPVTLQPGITAFNSKQETTSAQSNTSSMAIKSGRPQENPSKSSSASSRITSLPVRPPPPTRVIPPTSAAALSSSASYRQQGSEAFKKGDYTAAEVAYTRALSGLPSEHPAVIIILCNRSLVHLKNGDPKAAFSDAERALAVIGSSCGEGEKISLGGSEGDKDMRHFFAKALIRKAESLEQMEKWKEAADAWRQAVETGLGGAVSIQGRDRCEKAAGNDPQGQPPTRQRAPATKTGPASGRPAKPHRPQVSTTRPSEAVERLRQANEEAEKVDDQKFALADSVDARVEAWKSGKQDNIRALLVSLDTVLWREAGWKKVGLHELVMANKVKIIYMKGIAKVHPDKVSELLSSFRVHCQFSGLSSIYLG